MNKKGNPLKGHGKSALGIVQKFYPRVTAVIDAKHDVEIEVTAMDCSRATSKSPNACAMARAFKRTYDGAIISTSVAYLIRGDTAERYKVPNSVTREIVSFDRNHDFRAGQYRLNAPSAAFKLQPRRSRLKPERHDKQYGKVKSRHRTAGIRSL